MNETNVIFENNEVPLSYNDSNNYLQTVNLYFDAGLHFFNQKKFDRAVKNLKKSLELALLGSINYPETDEFYELEISLRSKISEVLIKQGESLCYKRDYDSALECFIDSIDINSNNAESYFKVGQCFYDLKNYDMSIKYLNKSLQIDPYFSESFRVLGDTYNAKEDPKNAIENYEEFILLNDKNEYVYNMLGHLYYKSHNIKKAILYFKLACDLNHSFQIAYSNFLYTTVKMPDFAQEHIFNLAVNTCNEFISNNKISDKVFIHKKRNKNSKIKIGYLSGDIKDHVVMKFMLPIFKNQNRKDFEIYCFYNNDSDWVTEEAKLNFDKDKFIQVKNLNDYQTAELIYQHKIDILVDLSGHTSCNKVFATAHKPAPIQVTYVGYSNTTGIQSIDYFLTNKELNEDIDNKFFAENLYFMDNCYRCFEDYKAVPKSHPDIAFNKNGYITFGSFNDLSKINDEVIESWAEILKRTPNSKILVCRTSLIKEYFYEKFLEYGIGNDRVILDKEFSFDKYNNIDIHLDTFPFSGVTVAFDSLTMGVPILTIKGNMFQGREAYNINKTLGLNEFIAIDKEDYIKKAVALSKDIEKLRHLKLNLRNMLQKSVFFKHKEFADSLEKCYVDMFSKLV